MSPSLPSHLQLRGALLTSLLLVSTGPGCNPPGGNTTSGDSDTIQITSVTATDSTALSTGSPSSDPSSSPSSSPTEDPTATTSSLPCSDGDARCTDASDRQVCKAGVWVDQPCAADEGCNNFGVCLPCSCSADACLDAATLGVCNCLELVPEACGPTSACDTVDGVTQCHTQVCNPDEAQCADADTVVACNATGTAMLPASDCPADQLCDFGKCLPACDVVAKNDSSTGCEFWSVDMANVPPRDAYVFGVALSNPNATLPVKIAIYDRNNNGGQDQLIVEGMIGPRDVEVFNLSGTSNGDSGYYPGDAGFLGTGIAKGRAFRITSELPIVATQFNPFGGALAFTTDASLLLPTHTLGKSYYHLAWDKGPGAGSALVVIATADNTNVTIRSTVDTAAGPNGMPALVAGKDIVIPGLKRNDYIQVSAAGKDLSSTRIVANAPIAVFGGHSCGNVPDTDVKNGLCDHLEEQIFPIDTWGVHYVAARSPARANEPMLWRVLASEDGTIVQYKPPVSIGSESKLDAGSFAEFTATGDFEITSNNGHPVLVAGYTYGCKTTGLPDCPGDPSMVLAVPVEQWLTDYVFLVDFSYTNNSIKLTRNKGMPVSLGCLADIPDWSPVNDKYETAVVKANPGDPNCQPGTNSATGSSPFSVMVVGESNSTSYAYPGGLALKPINPQ
jgi:hypothetical protein